MSARMVRGEFTSVEKKTHLEGELVGEDASDEVGGVTC